MSEGRWRVDASRHIVKDRWISLRADDCTTITGHRVAPYYVLEAPDIVFVLAIDEEDRVVFVRHYRHPLGAMSLELPGGVIDPEDADAFAAAARELREETGYELTDTKCVVTLNADPARYANRIHLVRGRASAPGQPSPDPAEEIEVMLVPRTEAIRLVLSGAIVGAAHAAAILIGLADRG